VDIYEIYTTMNYMVCVMNLGSLDCDVRMKDSHAANKVLKTTRKGRKGIERPNL
jgi:hypothetical protein